MLLFDWMRMSADSVISEQSIISIFIRKHFFIWGRVCSQEQLSNCNRSHEPMTAIQSFQGRQQSIISPYSSVKSFPLENFSRLFTGTSKWLQMIPLITHFCPPFQHLLSERLTSLGIVGAPRVPPLCREVPTLCRESQSLGQQMSERWAKMG